MKTMKKIKFELLIICLDQNERELLKQNNNKTKLRRQRVIIFQYVPTNGTIQPTNVCGDVGDVKIKTTTLASGSK